MRIFSFVSRETNPFCYIALVLLPLLASGCATIFSKSEYEVNFNTSPKEAEVVVKDMDGYIVGSCTTPCNLTLKAGEAYFERKVYRVIYRKEGYKEKRSTISASFDKWYYGNLFFTKILGGVILDPMTGAMYKIETRNINKTLTKDKAVTEKTIQNTRLSLKNDKLIITYDLKSDKSENVYVNITSNDGTKIDAKALYGAIGEDISGGEEQKIIWDMAEDNMDLGGKEIQVEVKTK